MKLAVVTAGLVLGLATAAGAASNWVLALPPIESGAKVDAKLDPLKSQAPGPDRTRQMIETMIDRTAPVDAWAQGPTFDRGEACEDARLQHLKEFDSAVNGLADTVPSGALLQRLAELGRAALGRCVPAFAFTSRPGPERAPRG